MIILPDWKSFVKKNAPLLMLLVLGVVLLTLPSGQKKTDGTEKDIRTESEKRLCRGLEQMEGVGMVWVLLSEKEGRDAGYEGAVVICSGADDASVRLRVVEAVSAFTQLGSNKIIVEKMDQ
ncbi:MAG: hypothetical protein IJT62_04820 [Oscillospiraceae bacterium]|nr:hypothetical protein [Oscillospiraceae bacterium]